MATDHYTRLKINKKVFDNLDEKGKKELIDKQFEKLKPKRWVELIPLNRFKLLESARDILKDSDLRQSYDHILENKFAKVNIQYSELKKISGTLKFMNKSVAKDKTVDHNNNQPQEQNKNLLPSPPTVSPDELQRIEKDLVVIKEQFEGMLEKARINVEGFNNKEIAKEIKGNALLELQHKTIQELEEKLKLNKKEPNSSVADHNNSQSQKAAPPKPPRTSAHNKHNNTIVFPVIKPTDPTVVKGINDLQQKLQLNKQTKKDLTMMELSIQGETKPFTRDLKGETVPYLKNKPTKLHDKNVSSIKNESPTKPPRTFEYDKKEGEAINSNESSWPTKISEQKNNQSSEKTR